MKTTELMSRYHRIGKINGQTVAIGVMDSYF